MNTHADGVGWCPVHLVLSASATIDADTRQKSQLYHI